MTFDLFFGLWIGATFGGLFVLKLFMAGKVRP
jgi:tetrahydromethanopterin S-methyltransferase subunit B